MAKVLIGYSVCHLTRAAFQAHGHDVWTNDLRPALEHDIDQHLQCDFWEAVQTFDWDFAVLHPMCTYLTCSAAWAFTDGPYHQKVKPGTLVGADRRTAREEALDNFRRLLALPFPVVVENPATSFVNNAIRPPDQVIQPHQFGDDASKATGLWLTKGAPRLQPTAPVAPRWVRGKGRVLPRWANQTDSGQNRLSPSDTRWLERSKTYPGIAAAMGDQWGEWLNRKDLS